MVQPSFPPQIPFLSSFSALRRHWSALSLRGWELSPPDYRWEWPRRVQGSTRQSRRKSGTGLALNQRGGWIDPQWTLFTLISPSNVAWISPASSSPVLWARCQYCRQCIIREKWQLLAPISLAFECGLVFCLYKNINWVLTIYNCLLCSTQ
jgi:hypothetical protein